MTVESGVSKIVARERHGGSGRRKFLKGLSASSLAVLVAVISVLIGGIFATETQAAENRPVRDRADANREAASRSSSDTSSAVSGDPVLVGAGDIHASRGKMDGKTAQLLDKFPAATVFTLGDHAYPKGSASSFSKFYDPTWGHHKDRTRPTPGNHDYGASSSASGYFGYFGAAAGAPGKGYYSYDLGNWHIVSLNSNCLQPQVGGCGADSPMVEWLKEDLEANTKPCTAAYWHHPRFSSGSDHGSDPKMQPAYQVLYDNNAEVVLSGNDHVYERFAPQNPNGGKDPARGIRQFVVGTGGGALDPFGKVRANSEKRNRTTHGVLKLTLRSNSYDWNFVPVAGKSFTDSGSQSCH